MRKQTFKNDSRLCSLSKDNNPRSLAVLFWHRRHLLGDLRQIGRVQLEVFSEGASLVFVTKDNVTVWQDLLHGLLEELAEEGSTEVHGETLVFLDGVFSDLYHAVG